MWFLNALYDQCRISEKPTKHPKSRPKSQSKSLIRTKPKPKTKLDIPSSIESRNKEVKIRADQRNFNHQQQKITEVAAKVAALAKRQELEQAKKLELESIRKRENETRREAALKKREELQNKKLQSIKQSKNKFDNLPPKPKRVIQTFESKRIARKELESAVFEIFRPRREIMQKVSVRKAFSGWVLHTMNMRILSGKIRGVIQFKSEHRIFMEWLKKARESRAVKETEFYKKEVVTKAKVEEFRGKSLVKKCFRTWRSVVSLEIGKRELQVERESTRNKIDSVLEALTKPRILKVRSDKFKNDKGKSDSARSETKGLNLNLTSLTDTTLFLTQLENSKFHKNSKPAKPSHSEKLVMIQQRKIIHEQKQLIEHLKKQKPGKISPDGDSRQIHSSTSSSRTNTTKRDSKPRSSTSTKTPKFLSDMEKRQFERNERIQNLKQARELKAKKIEEENKKREAEAIQKAEEIKISEIKSKKKKLAEERAKLESKKSRMKWEKEKMLEVNIFREKWLKKRGVGIFKKTIQQKREKMCIAKRHFILTKKKKVVSSWKMTTEESLEKSFDVMRVHYQTKIQKKCLLNWKNINYRVEVMTRQAERISKKRLKTNCLTAWRDFNEEQQMVSFRKVESCKQLFDRVLLKRVFSGWRSYRTKEKEEVKKAERIEHLCKKVSEFLPDFKY